MSETSDTLADSRAAAFLLVNECIERACYELDQMWLDYMNSDIDYNRKVAVGKTLEARKDYLRGLKWDPNAHPWVEDE